MKDIGGLQFSHGILDGNFWFRVRRNNIPASYYIELDPSVVATTADTTATSFGSFQPKVFSILGRYWAFYSRGASGYRYKTSTDGESWSGEGVLVDPAPVTAGSGLAMWYEEAQGFLHYVRCHGAEDFNHIYYRRGTPTSGGSITWSAVEQTYTGNNGANEYYYPAVTLDSNRYVWIGYRNMSVGVNGYPYMIRSEQLDGTFSCDELIQLNTSIFADWMSIPIPLTASKIYGIISGNGTQRGGRLYNGATWGSFEWFGPWSDNPLNQPRIPNGGLSAISQDDDIFLAFPSHNTSAVPWDNCWGWVVRLYSVGSWSDPAYYDSDVYGTTTPACVSAIGINNFLIWFIAGGDLWYRRYYNGVMDSQRTLGLDADITLAYTSSLNSWRFAFDNIVSLLWTDNVGGTYYVTFGLFSAFQNQWAFTGPYDENTGYSYGSGGVNVTAYFSDGNISETFLVDYSYVFSHDSVPLYFYMNTSTPREYWLSPNETSFDFEIYDQSLTTYTIVFLDLAGALDDYPFVEAQRYVNGSLRSIEKKRVDEEQKITMALVSGAKYNLIIQDGASYTFGDLLATSATTIQLTLKGIMFPKEVELVYRYIRIYGVRQWGLPNGNITITYEDTLELTNSVNIYINYKNGTNAYNATETADSFSHTWSSANNLTDYAVLCTIDHARHGSYNWRQYFPQSFTSTAPWGLDFLGTFPFDSSVIIPLFIIMAVAGVFSQVNAEASAFFAVVTAIILTMLNWIAIPAGALITAFCLAVLMAIVYSKRRAKL